MERDDTILVDLDDLNVAHHASVDDDALGLDGHLDERGVDEPLLPAVGRREQRPHRVDGFLEDDLALDLQVVGHVDTVPVMPCRCNHFIASRTSRRYRHVQLVNCT